MCGIAGFLSLNPRIGKAEATATATHMAEQIATRGPDDRGVWVDADTGIALAHRRLSVLDLSSAGHQPMASTGGRFVLVFNGEVYNHGELRRALAAAGQAPPWRGQSDTETLLAGFEAWGIAATLKRSVGMFALAIWDTARRELTLARDRFGEKPLYLGWQGATLLFGSELKALRAHPDFAADLDHDALALYLRHSYIPAPFSIHQGIRKLMPAQMLTVDIGKGSAGRERSEVYWSATEIASAGQADPFAGSEIEAIDGLEQVLRDAIAGQMVADVPLGAFLSGGIDSSTIVAIMQAHSAHSVRTFSIGFHEPEFNEAQHAAAVARHLGTEHTELYVQPADALAVIPDLPTIYDEPFSDSSQVPTYLVSRLAREAVTVALCGDGGDELFGGYNRHRVANRFWRQVGWIPLSLRAGLGRQLMRRSTEAWDDTCAHLSCLLPRRWRHGHPGDKVHKLARLLALTGPEAIYRDLCSPSKHSRELLRVANEPDYLRAALAPADALPDLGHRMMLADAQTYLPNDLLVKVDRAAMAHSLETRLPYLDHRVFEYAWQLPLDVKIRAGRGKWVLRQVQGRYLPPHLTDRPKMGFSVPVGNWLRGPLQDWAEDLLEPKAMAADGLFDTTQVQRLWHEHRAGRRNATHELWSVLMFQAWKGAQ